MCLFKLIKILITYQVLNEYIHGDRNLNTHIEQPPLQLYHLIDQKHGITSEGRKNKIF